MSKIKCVSLSLLSLLLIVCCAGCMAGTSPGHSGKPTDVNANGSQSQSAKRTADGGPVVDNGGAGGAGDGLDGGLDGGGGDARPLTQQSLFDFTQTGIAPWGPVVEVLDVVVEGVHYSVKRLPNSDPFLAFWQMENGDLVFSNRSPEELIGASTLPEVPQPTEIWNGPDGERVVYQREVFVSFTTEATQQEIEALISLHDLFVATSWFEPAEEPEQANSIAILDFRYPVDEFASLQVALDYFEALPHVQGVYPSYAEAFQTDYAGGVPADDIYENGLCRQVNILGVDSCPYIDYGPPYGNGWIARTTVAVLDVGVVRVSEDFAIPGYPSNYKKISWNGVKSSDVYDYVKIGFGWGDAPPVQQWEDPKEDGAQLSHGTKVAGAITACTINPEVGCAGLAPKIGVLPVALVVTRVDNSGIAYTSNKSLFNAYIKLRKTVYPGYWYEDVRVANYSSSVELNPNNKYDRAVINDMASWIGRDSLRCNRLTVASAGNVPGAHRGYPAAIDCVLGVSGIFYYRWGSPQFASITDDEYGVMGSSYWQDENSPPTQRLYPVSGVYGVCNATGTDYWEEMFTPKSPVMPPQPNHPSHYGNFSGTSSAAAQVSALAALLWLENSSASYAEVSAHIVAMRNLTVENYMESHEHVPLAGTIRFTESLAMWP